MAEPKVTLLTWTKDPLETVYSVWWQSKNEKPLMTPDEVKENVPPSEVEELFKAVIAQRIPVGEHLDFVFVMENVSVSWREQAVRHRIGVKVGGERLGVDVIPNLADSSWWSQSMRIQNMGSFFSNGAYRMPKSLDAHPEAKAVFCDIMCDIEAAYNNLIDMGVPMEDAREVIPLGAQHRISWKLNIGALQHIMEKRGCWILQLGTWGPIITGMVDELANKVHPVFRELVTPPCIRGDKFNSCVFMEECRRRLTGDDELPPCPLHYNYHVLPESQRGMIPLLVKKLEIPMKSEMMRRSEDYANFWGRDPFTGEKIV